MDQMKALPNARLGVETAEDGAVHPAMVHAQDARGRDLTSGPITRTLVMFAIPTMASNVLQTLNGSVNSIWVGRFLGEDALAATTNANIIMFMLLAVVFGFGMASTVMIAQAVGGRDVDAARRAFGSATGFCVLMTLGISMLGWVFTPDILHLMATPPGAYPLALDYLRVIFIGMPAQLLVVMIGMGLRGTGNAVTPLWFMVLTVILDAGLNPVFILGIGPAPRMGIAGSAAATAIAAYVTVVAMVTWLYSKDALLRLRGKELRYLIPDPKEMRVIIGKGLPMGMQMVVMSLAMVTITGFINREGVLTTAAYGAAQQLWNYIQMPAMAVGAAVSAMVAQNIGAGRWDRVGRITRSGIILNIVMTTVPLAIILVFDRQMLALFLGSGSPAIAMGRHLQLLASWSFLFFSVTMVMFSTMRANGVVIAPLFILAFSLFPIRIGFYYLAYPVLGADAIWIGFPLGSIASLLLATILYRRGKWRQKSLAVPGLEAEQPPRA